MPRDVTVRAPDWEPASRRLILRVTPSELHELDVLAAEFGVSRTWLVRRSLGRGLPSLAAEVRAAHDAGLRLAAPRRRGGEAVRGSSDPDASDLVFVPRGREIGRRRPRRPPVLEWD